VFIAPLASRFVGYATRAEVNVLALSNNSSSEVHEFNS
jgi:hypothetical protein